MDDRARTVQARPAPPKVGTKHLVAIICSQSLILASWAGSRPSARPALATHTFGSRESGGNASTATNTAVSIRDVELDHLAALAQLLFECVKTVFAATGPDNLCPRLVKTMANRFSKA